MPLFRSSGCCWCATVLIFLSVACRDRPAVDSTSPRALTVGVGPVSAGTAGVYTAADLRLFEERNLAVSFVPFTNAALCISAMLSGQVPLCAAISGVVVARANQAGADVRGVASLVDTMPYSLMVAPHIKTPADLRGRRVGINRPGSSTEHALRFGLDKLGLSLDDVELVTVGEQPQRLAALVAGSIDATLVAPPGASAAEHSGFGILLKLSDLGIAYPHSMLVARSDFMRTDGETVRHFIEAVAAGTYRFKADQTIGVEVLARHLGTDNHEDLVATYAMFSPALADPPLVSEDGLRAVLDVLTLEDSVFASMAAHEIIDMRFVHALQTDGTLQRLRDASHATMDSR